jgi:hypothetical protein
MFENRYYVTFQNPQGGGQSPALSLESSAKPKRINNIETWDKAFRMFVGVYTQKYAHEPPNLMKYGEIVHDLAAGDNYWRFYDENFRFLRQSAVGSHPWGCIHWELWLKAQLQQPRAKANNYRDAINYRDACNQFRSNSNFAMLKGFCYKYQKSLDCSECAFKHSCFKCQGNHRALNCAFRGPSDRKGYINPGPQLLSQSLPTPVNIDRLLSFLDGYNPSTVLNLSTGFREGFHIDHAGPHISFCSDNLVSALQHPEIVDAKFRKELDAHRLAGPFYYPLLIY